MLDDPYESPGDNNPKPRPSILATELSLKWVCLVSLFIFLLSYSTAASLTTRRYLPPWVSNVMWDRLHLLASIVAMLSSVATIGTGSFWFLKATDKFWPKQPIDRRDGDG